MQYSLNNVVVTGACGGLGTALVTAALSRGAQVALVGLDSRKLQTVAAAGPGRCVMYTPDVSDPGAMRARGQGVLAGVASISGWHAIPGLAQQAAPAHDDRVR